MSLTDNNDQQDTMELYHEILQNIQSQDLCCNHAKEFAQQCTDQVFFVLRFFYKNREISSFEHTTNYIYTRIVQSVIQK